MQESKIGNVRPIRKVELNTWQPWVSKSEELNQMCRRALDRQGFVTLDGKVADGQQSFVDSCGYAVMFADWIGLGLSGVDAPRRFCLIHDGPQLECQVPADAVAVSQAQLNELKAIQTKHLMQYTHFESRCGIPVCGADVELDATPYLGEVTCPSCKDYIAYRLGC